MTAAAFILAMNKRLLVNDTMIRFLRRYKRMIHRRPYLFDKNRPKGKKQRKPY